MKTERIEQLRAEIKAIDAQQRTLGETKSKKNLELAALLCPFEVGQVGQLNGRTYQGKRAVISSIFLEYGKWRCRVTVLKSDGTESANMTEMYREEDFILEG